jgi:abequosyltransferase
MSPKLSLCIPTYNRAGFIGDTLDSIISQASDDVEIVISDNASTDNTQELIKYYQRKFPRIRYFRWETNMGPDQNFMKVVELAHGEYCWLMGSDDAIAPGVLKVVLDNCDADILMLNLLECTFSLKPMGTHEWLSTKEDALFHFSNPGETENFFGSAQPFMGMFLGYLSSIIVKKQSWNKEQLDPEFLGSFFSFTYILLKMINAGGTLRYLKTPAVLNRGYNDSMGSEFSENSALSRSMLDVDAYLRFEEVIKGADNKKAFLDIARRNYTWYPLLKIRALMDSDSWTMTCEKKFIRIGCSRKVLYLVGFLGYFRHIFNAILRSKRRLLPQTRIIPRKLQ